MKILYYDSVYAYIENNKKEILNFMRDNEIEPTQDAIESYAEDAIHDEYINLLSCLEEYDNKNNYDYILVCCDLGLWYGRRKFTQKITTLKEAIIKTSCCYSNRLYFIKSNATLYAESIHHDGINKFKFYAVKNGKKTSIKYNDLIACY